MNRGLLKAGVDFQSLPTPLVDISLFPTRIHFLNTYCSGALPPRSTPSALLPVWIGHLEGALVSMATLPPGRRCATRTARRMPWSWVCHKPCRLYCQSRDPRVTGKWLGCPWQAPGQEGVWQRDSLSTTLTATAGCLFGSAGSRISSQSFCQKDTELSALEKVNCEMCSIRSDGHNCTVVSSYLWFPWCRLDTSPAPTDLSLKITLGFIKGEDSRSPTPTGASPAQRWLKLRLTFCNSYHLVQLRSCWTSQFN